MTARGIRPAWLRMLAALVAVMLAAGSVFVAPRQAQAATSTYTVKFDANGGTGTMKNQTITRDKSTALTANAFKRSAYVFTGWNTQKDGKGKAYGNKASVKNLAAAGKTITLYAQWRKGKHYTVKFNANGGKGTTSDQSITYNKATALRANAFTKTDYAFTGWNTKKDGTGKVYKNKASVTNLAAEGKTITLYAQWKINVYTVKFAANGGTGTMAVQKITVGKATALQANSFTRSDNSFNYAFTAWNTRADGKGTAYKNKVSVTNLVAAGKTVTLYAQWKPTNYLVNFNANGGSGTMAAQKITVGKVSKLAKNVFTRAGYRFVGWNEEIDDTGTPYEDKDVIVDDIVAAGKKVTLYAQWEPTTYTINYDANAADATGVMGTTSVTAGRTFRLTKNGFSREGYEFQGWTAQPDGGDWFIDCDVVVDDLAPAGESVTLYAQWKKQSGSQTEPGPEPETGTYTVAYDANGGDGTMTSKEIPCGSIFMLVRSAFTREGYEFACWNSKADGTGESFVDREVIIDDLAAADETVTLYAQWKKVEQEPVPGPEPTTYTVAFDPNGGTGEMASYTATSGKIYKVPAVAFTREDYTFAGWNTKADGTGESFVDREVIVEDLAAADETVTLYAQWKQASTQPEPGQNTKSFTIHLDANGGEGEMADQSLAEGQTVRLAKSAFARVNHSFVGWNTKADGTGDSFDDRALVVYGDLTPQEDVATLYAQWKGTDFTIIFEPNGGTGETQSRSSSDLYRDRYGDQPQGYGLPSAANLGFEKSGYFFYGWAESPDAGPSEAEHAWGADRDMEGLRSYDPCWYEGVWQDSNLIPKLGETKTLYAIWSEECTIQFDANGVEGANMPKPIKMCRELPVYVENLDDCYPDIDGSYSGHPVYETGNRYVDYWSMTPDCAERASFTVNTDEVIDEWWDGDQHNIVYATRYGTYAELFPEAGNTVTLYAHWNWYRLDLRYDANGGEGEMDGQWIESGYESYDDRAHSCGFTRDGYEFTGWNTAADGSGQSFSEWDYVGLGSFDSISDDGSVTLYAQWEQL